jgi:hypothetical protein
MEMNSVFDPLSINLRSVSAYLSNVLSYPVQILSIKKLGTGVLGASYLLETDLPAPRSKLVLKVANPSLGQDFPADRAAVLLYAHTVYNKLQHHVRSFDVGAITRSGALKSLGDAEEFFIIMEFVEGEEYAKDLDRIKNTGCLSSLDVERIRILADYEAEIHRVKCPLTHLYVRRLRELLGRGDCIAGIIDYYPKDERTYSFTDDKELEDVEKKCVEWRWKLKGKAYRLSQIHGDIHPFNIIWQGPRELKLLDRSRGEWGEPADDVACLSINYIFWSLMAYGLLQGPFDTLFNSFLSRYLETTGDEELMTVIQPFYAFRCLVIANPIFYPKIDFENRRSLFNFMNAVLDTDTFNPKDVNSYLKS